MTPAQKNVLLFLTIIAALTGIYSFTVGEFGVFKKSSNPADSPTEPPSQQPSVDDENVEGVIQETLSHLGISADDLLGSISREELFALLDTISGGKKSFTCSVSDDEADITLFTNGEQLIAESIAKDENVLAGNVFVDRSQTYVWFPDNDTGYVFANATSNATQQEGKKGSEDDIVGSILSAESIYGLVYNHIFTRQEDLVKACVAHNDVSIFTKPAGITFSELDLSGEDGSSGLESILQLPDSG